MQIAIHLTVRQSGITKISRAEELGGLPFEDLDCRDAVAGLHVGFQNFDWQLEQFAPKNDGEPRLWLTEAAHSVLGPIFDPSFFGGVKALGGQNFFGVTQAGASRMRETFRPGESRAADASQTVATDASPDLQQDPVRPADAILECLNGGFDFLRAASQQVLQTPVGKAGFSNRVKGVFALKGIEKVGDLIGMDEQAMLTWNNFGRTSLQNVLETLHALIRAAAGPSRPRPEISASNWIESLDATHPELSHALRCAGIQTDDDYIAHEAAIGSFHTRVRLAELRFAFLTAGQDVSETPGLVAQACPPWVLERQIGELTMPNSCSKKLLDQGVRTVGDLTQIPQRTLLRWRAFGATTRRDVCVWIARSIQDGPTDRVSLRNRYSGYLVKDWITEAFQELSSLDPAILTLREAEALNGRCNGMTLQQVGDNLVPRCTRERARQLEATALAVFKRRAFWAKLLTEKLDRIFETARGPVAVPALPSLDPDFAGVSETGESFYWVLENVLPRPVFSVSSADFDSEILARISLKTWKAALNSGRRLLRNAVLKKEEHAESDLKSEICSMLPQEAAELRSHLWQEVSRRAIFADRGGIRMLAEYGGGNEIVELLETSDTPLHWTEIVARVKDMPPASVRNRLMELEDVFRFGPGTYGVQKHFRLSTAAMQSIAAECRAIAQGRMDRQWSCAEFCEELHNNEFHVEGHDESLTPDIINNALKLFGEKLGFVNAGRLVWKLGGEGGAAARLKILPECLDILKQNGRPMLVDELRRRLVETRGLGAFLQLTTFHKDGLTVIRMDPQRVGILELHAGALAVQSRREQLIQAVREALVTQQRGLHVSELASVADAADLMRADGADPILLVDVCRLSKSIRFSQGSYLYLSEWGGDRRWSLTQTIEMAFEGVSGGLTNQQLLEKMARLMGRVVTWSEVLGAIYRTSARRDEANGVWMLKKWDE